MRDLDREKFLAGRWRVADTLSWAARPRSLRCYEKRLLLGLALLADQMVVVERRWWLLRQLMISSRGLELGLLSLESLGLVSVRVTRRRLDIALLVLGTPPVGRGAQLAFSYNGKRGVFL